MLYVPSSSTLFCVISLSNEQIKGAVLTVCEHPQFSIYFHSKS